MLLKTLFYLLFVLLLSCASSPEFDTSNVDRLLTPKKVVNNIDAALGKTVIWGGTILEVRNLPKETQIEVLAYPLSSSHQPQADKPALGRFIIVHKDYLEPTNFSQGKSLSVLAQITGTRKATIGESPYTYVVVRAKQLHLWSASNQTQTFFHFGIGIEL